MDENGHALWDDTMQRVSGRVGEKRKYLRIEGKEIVFVGKEYRIPLEGCATYAEIIRWVLQLSEKTWTDKEIISAFVVCALTENNI